MFEVVIWLWVIVAAQSLLIVIFYKLWQKNMRLLMDITHMNLKLSETLVEKSK